MSPPRNKVVELIAKLKALASDSSNEHEAALAAERMQELIARHKIAQAELMEIEAGEQPVGIEDLFTEDGRNFARWRLNLAHIIAHANNCYGLHTKGGLDWSGDEVVMVPSKMEIVGTPENVAACQYIFQYLCREIDRLAKRANAAAKLRGLSGGRRYMNSFRVGAVVVISKRLREQRARATENETAMALFDQEIQAAMDWAQERMDIKHAGSIAPSASSCDGYLDGAAAGRSLALDGGGRKSLGAPRKALPGGRPSG